jgi:hypothetical protein
MKTHGHEKNSCVIADSNSNIVGIPWTFSLGIKQQCREADYSPLSSAEVRNGGIYTSTPPYVLVN